MAIGIIEIIQLKPAEIKKLDKAVETTPNLHTVIGCGRTAIWRARKGMELSVQNLNAIRTYLQSQKVAAARQGANLNGWEGYKKAPLLTGLLLKIYTCLSMPKGSHVIP